MEEALKKIRLNYSISDETLDINAIAGYDLYFLIDKKSLRICVMDTRSHKCLFLEDYKFSQVATAEDFIQYLNELHESHKLLPAGYWRVVRLCVRGTPFTILPSILFDEEYPEEVIRLTLPDALNNEEKSVYYFKQSTIPATTVFTGNRLIINWFKNNYPTRKIEVIHQISAFIEGVINESNYKQDAVMHIDVEGKYMNVVVVANKELKFANTFHYQSPQDFVYFVLFALDELKLNPDICPLVLYGEISPDSSIYNLLYKYVRHIRFGKRPLAISFNYQFDDILEHRYFDLFGMYFCN